jgi:hypothetical protein
MQRGKRDLSKTSAPRSYKEENWGNQLIVGSQFCIGILKEGPERGKLKKLHC